MNKFFIANIILVIPLLAQICNLSQHKTMIKACNIANLHQRETRRV